MSLLMRERLLVSVALGFCRSKKTPKHGMDRLCSPDCANQRNTDRIFHIYAKDVRMNRESLNKF